MDATHVMYAQLGAEGCTAELWLNGFPISRITPRGLRGESVAVQQFLVSGKNELKLVVEPGSRPSTTFTEKRQAAMPEAKAEAWVVLYPDGAEPDPDNGDVFARLHFETPEPKEEAREWPVVLSQWFEHEGAVGRWSWQDAPPLALGAPLIEEAREVLRQLGERIQAGVLEPYWELTEIQIQESLLAYPALSDDIIRADLIEFLGRYQGVPELVFPLDREAHDFRLVAGGRVLQCIDRDGSTSLKLRHPRDGSVVPCYTFLARIQGQLRLVR